jgi:hypothetical protein
MVMPVGLCDVPATFERWMETVLWGLTYESCLVYPENVIMIGRMFQEHLFNVRKVFQQFQVTLSLVTLGGNCHLFTQLLLGSGSACHCIYIWLWLPTVHLIVMVLFTGPGVKWV